MIKQDWESLTKKDQVLLKIPLWLVTDKDIELIERGYVIKQTEKAVYFRFLNLDDSVKKTEWLPKNSVEISDIKRHKKRKRSKKQTKIG